MEPTQERWYQRRIAELENQVRQRDERIAALERQVAQLMQQIARLNEQVARLSKNSSNSSKPPSSDIVKPRPPGPGRGRKRKIGGQPGHPKHQREPFAPEELDEVRRYRLDRCPDCGGKLRPGRAEDRVVQQIEIPDRPVEIIEHRSAGCWWETSMSRSSSAWPT